MNRAFTILFEFCSAACLLAQMGNMTGPEIDQDVAPILERLPIPIVRVRVVPSRRRLMKTHGHGWEP